MVISPAAAGAGEHRARRADAVVVEPPPALPSAVERSPAEQLVTLRVPLGQGLVEELVRDVVSGWQHESLDDLTAVLTADAGPFEARSHGRGALIEGWRQRLHSHEYRRLAGIELARPERIERYAWDDLPADRRPHEMRPGELYVRVPLEVTRVAGERLFGDVILLLLRRDGDKYKVTGYGESNGS